MAVEGKKNKRKCPRCGSIRIVPIFYGLPGEEALRLIEERKAIMGGCVLSHESPRYACMDCGCRW